MARRVGVNQVVDGAAAEASDVGSFGDWAAFGDEQDGLQSAVEPRLSCFG